MGIADKKYSNVDKNTAEILVEAKLLLEEEGYEVSKPREKSIARELMNVCRARAAALLAEVGLADRHDHYPAQMSGGEQQRVALARAMVADPPVLFADEPTGNLDQSTGESIMQLILNLAKNRNSTLFLITHDANLAQKCDRTLTMRDGVLV